MKNIIIAIMVAIFVPIVAFKILSFTPAAIVSSIVIFIEAINLFGLCYATRKLPSHPKYIETASSERVTELLMGMFLFSSHLLDNEILDQYPSIVNTCSKEMRDCYCMATVLRLYLFKLMTHRECERAVGIFTRQAESLFSSQLIVADEFMKDQIVTFPGNSFVELSKRKFGGDLELCQISFASLQLANALTPLEIDSKGIAEMIFPKLKSFIGSL